MLDQPAFFFKQTLSNSLVLTLLESHKHCFRVLPMLHTSFISLLVLHLLSHPEWFLFSLCFVFFFPSLHFAYRCSSTVSTCTFRVCKMCKINFKYNSGKDRWVLEPLSYNLWKTFPVIVTEIKSIVQAKFLDCLGVEKLKKGFLVENSSCPFSIKHSWVSKWHTWNRFLIFSCLNANTVYLNQGDSKEYSLQLQTSV